MRTPPPSLPPPPPPVPARSRAGTASAWPPRWRSARRPPRRPARSRRTARRPPRPAPPPLRPAGAAPLSSSALRVLPCTSARSASGSRRASPGAGRDDYSFSYLGSETTWKPDIVSLNDGKLYGVDLRFSSPTEGKVATHVLPFIDESLRSVGTPEQASNASSSSSAPSGTKTGSASREGTRGRSRARTWWVKDEGDDDEYVGLKTL